MSSPSTAPSSATPTVLPKATVFIDFPGGAASFVDVLNTTSAAGSPRLTPTVFTLDADIANVIAQDPTSGKLLVMDKVAIEFQLATGFGFRPVGVTFKQIQALPGGADSNGRDNFPRSTLVISDDPRKLPCIRITNIFKQQGVKWKIFIVIQDDRGSLGVIDPEIENSDLNLNDLRAGRAKPRKK